MKAARLHYTSHSRLSTFTERMPTHLSGLLGVITIRSLSVTRSTGQTVLYYFSSSGLYTDNGILLRTQGKAAIRNVVEP